MKSGKRYVTGAMWNTATFSAVAIGVCAVYSITVLRNDPTISIT